MFQLPYIVDYQTWYQIKIQIWLVDPFLYFKLLQLYSSGIYILSFFFVERGQIIVVGVLGCCDMLVEKHERIEKVSSAVGEIRKSWPNSRIKPGMYVRLIINSTLSCIL